MIAALVPAKSLAQAKSRLAGVLVDDERRRLALAMLEDVLGALIASPRIGLAAVVSPDAAVLALADRLGGQSILEPPDSRGVNQALAHALAALVRRNIEALLVLPVDVPAIAPTEVDAVIDALPPDGGVVLCPSLAHGTSALALRPPNAIPFRFGENSFAAHRREASTRGLPTRVLRIPSLANDIDDPQDLIDLLSRPVETPTRAAATLRLLSEIDLARRLATAAGASTRPA